MLKLDLPNDVRIGHVHLRVADLTRSKEFYRDVLGFHVTIEGPSVGLPAVFMAAGDYHHHIGLNTFGGAGAAPPPPGHSGLYHFAILYPDERSLARAVIRLYEHGHPISHASDHGGTVSVYLHDPDGIGIELYFDRPREQWYDANGLPIVKSEAFDPRDVLAMVNMIDRLEQFA